MERGSDSYWKLRQFKHLLTGIVIASCTVATARGQTLSVSECERVTMSMLDPNTSPVSPAIQELRRRMLDADVNTLTFHNMDEIFWTRTVPRGGPVWEILAMRHDGVSSLSVRGDFKAHHPVRRRADWRKLKFAAVEIKPGDAKTFSCGRRDRLR